MAQKFAIGDKVYLVKEPPVVHDGTYGYRADIAVGRAGTITEFDSASILYTVSFDNNGPAIWLSDFYLSLAGTMTVHPDGIMRVGRFVVYLPQSDGGLLQNYITDGMSSEDAKLILFGEDINAIDQCDVVVAILDGAHIDEGVAFEVGYAYAKGKICLGLQTDMRRQTPYGNNVMLSAVKQIFDSESALVTFIRSVVW